VRKRTARRSMSFHGMKIGTSVSAVTNGGSRPKGRWEERVRRRPAIVFTFLRPAPAITNISPRVIITVSVRQIINVHECRKDVRQPTRTEWPRFTNRTPALFFSAHKHNTYHGPTKHFRSPLSQNLDAKPLRFTDSPQHRLSRSRRKTKPSPRRKSSSGCVVDDKTNSDVSFVLIMMTKGP